MKILLDTDIGGDVDDALALALALRSPEIDIIGISLVYIANEWRANILKNMLQVYGREDIPFVIGAEKPIVGYWGDAPPNLKDNTAAEFIISQCDNNPDLVLVPIGPLTNIAAAFAAAPRIAQGRKVMIMGGALNQARAEWNIFCDPEAASIVLESGADIHMVGLNVTERCQFTSQEVSAFDNSVPEGKLMGDMIDKFIKDYNYLPILHDPLTVASLIWDDLLTFETKKIAVELKGLFSRGFLVEAESGAKVNIATNVNDMLFKQRLLERIRK